MTTTPTTRIAPTTITGFPAGASAHPAPIDPASAADVVVELFYVEMKGCAPCANAIAEVDEAASLVRDELAVRGHSLTVRTVPLHDPGHARALGIDNPVTVRVAGRDVSPDDPTLPFAACGIAGVAPKNCRSHEWNGQPFDAPPAGLIVEAVHRHVDEPDDLDAAKG